MSDTIILIARVLIGWLFLTNGFEKLMHMSATAGYLTQLSVPAASLMAWPTMAGELLIGAALILGLFTRCAALASVVFTAVATLLAHRYWELPLGQQSAQYIHFCKNLAIMGGGLLLYVIGAGRFSIDAIRSKR
ncbi:MAG: DoxX family protein [Pseudolabrys sp.]|nr:DoxX family protein [Pseudolabrys sp.]